VHRLRDRLEAGRALAGLLSEYASRRDVVALALPRGGVTVAYEVAAALSGQSRRGDSEQRRAALGQAS